MSDPRPRAARALRRWAGVITAPSTSDDVTILKFAWLTALPLSVLHIVAVAAGWEWPSIVRPFDLVWLYLLLLVVRQRDEARARQGRR